MSDCHPVRVSPNMMEWLEEQGATQNDDGTLSLFGYTYCVSYRLKDPQNPPQDPQDPPSPFDCIIW